MGNIVINVSVPVIILVGLGIVFLLYHVVKGWSAQKKLAAMLDQRHELRKRLTVKDDEIRVMRTLYEMNFEELCWLTNVEALTTTQLKLIKERLHEAKLAVTACDSGESSLAEEMQWRVDLYQGLRDKMAKNIEIRLKQPQI